MSGNDTGAPATNSAAPQFTERELQMLGWAMQSLKTGPPEIDYDKLAGFAGMSNPRSASNAWAKIKGKLNTSVPEGGSPAPTPKKAGGKKKAAAATPAADDGEEGAPPATPKPKATPRKRAAKKQDVGGEDASPMKKGRQAKKPVGEEKAVKAEPEEVEDVKIEDAPAVEESIEEEV